MTQAAKQHWTLSGVVAFACLVTLIFLPIVPARVTLTQPGRPMQYYTDNVRVTQDNRYEFAGEAVQLRAASKEVVIEGRASILTFLTQPREDRYFEAKSYAVLLLILFGLPLLAGMVTWGICRYREVRV